MKVILVIVISALILLSSSYVLSQTQSPSPSSPPGSSASPVPSPSQLVLPPTPSTTPDKIPALLDSTVKQDIQGSITFTFLASYSENSTGLIKLISNADCKIEFTDSSGKQSMSYNQNSGYAYTRNFTESASLSYTVTCSHPNYMEKTQTRKIEVEVKKLTTEIVLLEPKGSIKTKDVVFICEARGPKPKSISLYSDTSGEMKKRAQATITTSKPPFRVQFTENDVSDGTYKWNCEAETDKGTISAASDQTFTLKFVPVAANCIGTESKDCAPWRPDACPPSGEFTRTCNNTISCNYKTSKPCTSGTLVNATPAADVSVQAASPPLPSTKKPATGTGLDITQIILIVAIIVGAVFLFLKLRKRKKIEPEEGFEDDGLQEGGEFGEEPPPQEPENGGEDENRDGEGAGDADKGEPGI